MSTLIVTIVAPTGEHDLELPADVPLNLLMRLIESICVQPGRASGIGSAARWALAWGDGRTLALDQTLESSGALDGMKLVLQDVTHAPVILPSSPDNVQDTPTAAEGVHAGGVAVRWNKEAFLN